MSENLAAQSLGHFEENMGIQLPTALKRLFLEPIKLDYCEIPDVEDFISLDEYRASLPARFIPLFREPSGDVNGLYYPRGSDLVIVCFFAQGQELLIPQTTDLDGYFLNPDLYSPEHPDNDDEVPQDAPDNWKSLLYDMDSPRPELEILKPFCLNSAMDGEWDLENLQKLVTRFSESPESDLSLAQRIIREKYEDSISLLDRSWWFGLFESFVAQQLWGEAIIALENCEAVHNVYPYYGHAKQGKSAPKWIDVLEVTEKLHSMAMTHGDAFDKATITRKLEIVTSFVRMDN